jgi:hypothetical protein
VCAPGVAARAGPPCSCTAAAPHPARAFDSRIILRHWLCILMPLMCAYRCSRSWRCRSATRVISCKAGARGHHAWEPGSARGHVRAQVAVNHHFQACFSFCAKSLRLASLPAGRRDLPTRPLSGRTASRRWRSSDARDSISSRAARSSAVSALPPYSPGKRRVCLSCGLPPVTEWAHLPLHRWHAPSRTAQQEHVCATSLQRHP